VKEKAFRASFVGDGRNNEFQGACVIWFSGVVGKKTQKPQKINLKEKKCSFTHGFRGFNP
jgi:hypothetical protein